MFRKHRNTVLASAAFAVALCQFSAPALANTEIDPNGPTVKCKKGGKRFPYQLNGSPTYASAAEKCAAYGGVDSGGPVIRGKPVVVKERAKAVQHIPPVSGCGGASGVQNQSGC